ncbi:hypothetical protein BJX70DRAFT_207400 [Aspergillus crustosus]
MLHQHIHLRRLIYDDYTIRYPVVSLINQLHLSIFHSNPLSKPYQAASTMLFPPIPCQPATSRVFHPYLGWGLTIVAICSCSLVGSMSLLSLRETGW